MMFFDDATMTKEAIDKVLTESHGEHWAGNFTIKWGNVCKIPAEQYSKFQKFLEGNCTGDQNWLAFQPIRPAEEGEEKTVSFAEALLRNNGFSEHGAPPEVFKQWTQNEKEKFMRWEIDRCIDVARRAQVPISVNCEDLIMEPEVLKKFSENSDVIHMEVLETAQYDPELIKKLSEMGIILYLDDYPEAQWENVHEYARFVKGFKFDYKLCLCVLDVKEPYSFPSSKFSAAGVLRSPDCVKYFERMETLRSDFFRTVQTAIQENPEVNIVFECTFDPAVVRRLMATHLQLDEEGVNAIMKQVYMQGADSMAAAFVPKSE